jgi:putative transposase
MMTIALLALTFVELIKDRDALPAFYDFPAEHWKHQRTTNVIESSFATVRHRHGF